MFTENRQKELEMGVFGTICIIAFVGIMFSLHPILGIISAVAIAMLSSATSD